MSNATFTTYDQCFTALEEEMQDELHVRFSLGMLVYNDEVGANVSRSSVLADWNGNAVAVRLIGGKNGRISTATVSQHKKLAEKWATLDDMYRDIDAAGLSRSFSSARKLCKSKPASNKPAKFDAKKVAKGMKSKYTKAQLAAILAELS